MGLIQPESAKRQDPRVLELMDLWRQLYAPPYMSDGFVARQVDRFVQEQGFGDDDLTGLRGDFLLRKLGLHVGSLEGVSMGRVFGNFMGMAGAMGVLAHTARLNDEGYVIRNDSENIFRFISLIQQHIPVFGKGLSSEMHHTVAAAAQYYLGAAQELGDVLFTMHNRVFKTVQGQTVAPGKIGTRNIEKWFRQSTGASEQLRQLLKGGQLFLTRLGLGELTGWVDTYTRPLGFLNSDIARHAAMDRFGTIDALPAVHPAYAASVGRILTDAMMAAEQNDLELRFRWDGFRNAVIADVPTKQARSFQDILEEGETSISPSDGRDQFWVERHADKRLLVVPTQEYIALQRFEDVATAAVGEVSAIVKHLYTINPKERCNPDLPDTNGRSLRDKLRCFAGAADPRGGLLAGMKGALEGVETQESRVVSEWITRLMYISGDFLSLYKSLDNEGAFASRREQCLRGAMFNLFHHLHMSARNWSIPGLRAEVFQPMPYVRPENWLGNYRLLLKFYFRMAQLAGAPAEGDAHPRSISALFSWSSDHGQIRVSNDDGILAESWHNAVDAYVAGDMRAIPRLDREIIGLSRGLDPDGVGLRVYRDKGVIGIPMKLASSGSPVVAKFPALQRGGGLVGMPRLPR